MVDKTEAMILEAARVDLASYIGALQKTDEGKPAIPPQHLAEQIIPALMDDSLGHTIIIAPPSSAKTDTMISAITWWLGRNPNKHIGLMCANAPIAKKRSKAIRDTIEKNPLYREIFPNALPDIEKGWTDVEWYLQRENPGDKNPSMSAAGATGTIIGSRFDYGILDDIANRENMNTPFLQEKMREWLQETFMTRLSSQSGRAIMICTRWAEGDPAGWALERDWTPIIIRALDTKGRSYWPQIWPREKLSCETEEHPKRQCCKRKEAGAKGWVQQYMGEVADESSARIKRGYWQYFRQQGDEFYRLESNGDLGELLDFSDTKKWKGGIFVDTAHTEKTENDYSVLTTAYTDGVDLFITRMMRAQVEFPRLLKMAKKARALDDIPIIVEDTTGGKPLIQTMKVTHNRVKPWPIRGQDKIARVEASLPFWESGNIYVPDLKGDSWVDGLITEAAIFPNGLHDDMVDTITMAVDVLLKKKKRKLGAH